MSVEKLAAAVLAVHDSKVFIKAIDDAFWDEVKGAYHTLTCAVIKKADRDEAHLNFWQTVYAADQARLLAL